MDINLCMWSQTPCKFKPYLPLRPHIKLMGPHFMIEQFCSVGFSVHTNIPYGRPLPFFFFFLCFLLSMCSCITMQLAVSAVVIVKPKVSSSSLSHSMSSSIIINEKTSTINEIVSHLWKTMGIVVR